ncbi:MAG TPA: AI-2E family transporter [Pyrinomonadaceae bacterium]|nr:AI-2E family transporter [Pyrinomonadaceae bacterium]
MREDTLRARWIAALAATALALYLCWLMLQPFVVVLEWATVLVIVFYPVHKRIAERIGRPGLSALVSCILVVVIVLVPLGFIIGALARELAGSAQTLQQVGPLFDPNSPRTGHILNWLQERGIIQSDPQQFLLEQARTALRSLLGQTLGLLGNVLSTIVKAFFVVFTMYYLFRDGDKIVDALPGVLPLKREHSEAILARTRQVISASVYGVVTIAIIQGALGGIAFWILGVPSPILWSVLLALICMIPIAGSFFVWIPVALYLGLTGHWTKALLMALWGGLVISTVDNFLRPKLMKQYTKLHELFVFFSVLGGMRIFGILGIVLGPVVLAVTIGLLNTFKPQQTTVD